MIILFVILMVIIFWAYYIYYVESQRIPGMVAVREENP